MQSLTSNGKATISFGSTPLQIKAGDTKTITIALNIKAGVYSSTVGLMLSKIVANEIVTGVPIISPIHSVIDGTQVLA